MNFNCERCIMRKHGKCFAALLAVMLFATASFSAAAYNEQDILNFVKGEYTVGSEIFRLRMIRLSGWSVTSAHTTLATRPVIL